MPSPITPLASLPIRWSLLLLVLASALPLLVFAAWLALSGFGLVPPPGRPATPIVGSPAMAAAVGAGLLVAGAGLAWLLGRRIAAGLASVRHAATVLADGRTPRVAPVGLREVDETARALERAGALLQDRGRERDRAAEEARQAGSGLVRLVADTIPALISYVDRDHRYRFVNRRFEQWFDAPPRSVAGRQVRDVLGEAAYQAVRPHLEQALAGRVVSHEATLPYRGATREVTVTYAPDVADGGEVRGAVALLVDVTARKVAERDRADLLDRALLASMEAQTTAERLRRLQAVTDVALARPGGDELPRALLAGLRLALDADAAMVLVHDEAAGELVELASDGRGATMGSGRRVPLGHGFAGAVAARREPMTLADGPGRDTGCPPGEGLRALLGVPVQLGDRLMGVVLVGSEAPGRFSGEHVGLLRLAADRVALVLEQRRLYRVEREARAAAEAESRAKSEWIAMLSHEVRSPLAAIQSAAAALEGVAARETGPERLRGVIARQVQHLARLTDDLLDVSRLETGRLALDRRPVDLRPVVQRAIGSLREAGKLGRQRLEVTLAAAWVDGDPTRLEQVAANLIDNAVKHTPAGGRIHVAVEPRDEAAMLRVADEGAGIPAELLPRVFDAFVQGPQSLAREHGGLGLGLTLVRRLVELHGGSVQASSPGLGQGAEFVVRLPRLAGRPPVPDAARTAAAPGRGLRVLVVEDSTDARFALRALLERWGHEVEEAEDGAAGLEAARRFCPDAVLIDLGLPGMDGLEMAEAIRGTPDGQTMVLLALTGHGRAEDRRRAERVRFDGYLLKPANPEELRRILAEAADRQAERDGPVSRGAGSGGAPLRGDRAGGPADAAGGPASAGT